MRQTALIFERWTPFSHGSGSHEYGLFWPLKCSHKTSFKREQTAPEQRYVIWLAAELEMVSDSLLRGEASWGLVTPSSRVKVPALRIKQPAYFLCRYLTLLHEWGQSISPIKISMSALISNLPLKVFFSFFFIGGLTFWRHSDLYPHPPRLMSSSFSERPAAQLVTFSSLLLLAGFEHRCVRTHTHTHMRYGDCHYTTIALWKTNTSEPEN